LNRTEFGLMSPSIDFLLKFIMFLI